MVLYSRGCAQRHILEKTIPEPGTKLGILYFFKYLGEESKLPFLSIHYHLQISVLFNGTSSQNKTLIIFLLPNTGFSCLNSQMISLRSSYLVRSQNKFLILKRKNKNDTKFQNTTAGE